MSIVSALLIILLAILFVALILVCAFDIKIDVTKEKEVLLWYSHLDEQLVKRRKFIRILKL